MSLLCGFVRWCLGGASGSVNLFRSFGYNLHRCHQCNGTVGTCECLCDSDVNECQEMQNVCLNGTCHNTIGSFTCVCHKGFKLTDNNDCYDVDECRVQHGICRNGRCSNSYGSFTCICQPGFRLSADSCVDLNECDEVENICFQGTCHNVQGSYTCSCHEGFALSRTGDECLDINECEEGGICGRGRCRNTLGSFTCVCAAGFVLSSSGRECRDIRPGSCFNRFQSGLCSSARRMRMTKSKCCCSYGAAWQTSDICEVCPASHDGAFSELCPDGYGYIKQDLGVEDINECDLDMNVCRNGRCINMDGSFRCECMPGYIPDYTGRNCVDDNECQSAMACGEGSCINVVGGFICECHTGYVPGPHQTCQDVDECLEETHMCAFRCRNTLGSFHCVCPKGYQLASDGKHCQDVDECLTANNDCPYACKNLVGSFMCVCNEGFNQHMDNEQCNDIDECATVEGVCQHGNCRNLEGAFRCESCAPGFQLSPDERLCLDVREGYCFTVLDGGSCLITDSPALAKTGRDKCCCGLGHAWGPQCELCPTQGTRAFHQLCPHGHGFTPEGQDVDECLTILQSCQHGVCMNTVGSYRCLCNIGFKNDITATRCIDMDECAVQPSPCQHACHNTVGSFSCSCPAGYQLDGQQCVDVDECELETHNCPCVNTLGSFSCTCPLGYQEQGQACIDVDECRTDASLCGQVGLCVNTEGSYSCDCPQGFELDKTGQHCVDVDECEEDETLCQYGCENLMGTFHCTCPLGFVPHHYWNLCVDENECMRQGACGQANCYNLIGSFTCKCSGLAVFQPNTMSCSGLGGYGCSAELCSFGCTSLINGGYMCECPQGYSRVGRGHCVATISPSSTQMPDGVQLPHVAAPNGQAGFPPGEGCYNCDINFNGMPLLQPPSLQPPSQQPNQQRHRRQSDISEHQMMIDVSNQHRNKAKYSNVAVLAPATSPATTLVTSPATTPVMTPVPTPGTTPITKPVTTPVTTPVTKPSPTGGQTPELMLHADQQIAMYLYHSSTEAGLVILSLLPSSVQHHQPCSLHGHSPVVMLTTNADSVVTLTLKHRLYHKQLHKFRLTCTQNDASHANRLSADFYLDVYLYVL